MAEIIHCEFNIFKEGRNYSGHHRKYILESAISTCYHPGTREKLQLREALGYFGHGRREMAGKLALQEVSTIKLPDGSSMIVENVPSNVTVAFEIGKDGTVTHSQQILESGEPGKIVSALNKDKVGGFSWACGGVNGGVMGATKIADFHGFDYVMQPGFASNRGYILESAGVGGDMILESVARATGLPDNRVQEWMKHWTASAILENAELQERILEASIFGDSLREELEEKTALLESANERLEREAQEKDAAKSLILEAAGKTLIAIPERIVHDMLNMTTGEQFQNVVAFFESAKQVSLKGLPLGTGGKVTIPSKGIPRTEPEYGQAAAAPEFD